MANTLMSGSTSDRSSSSSGGGLGSTTPMRAPGIRSVSLQASVPPTTPPPTTRTSKMGSPAAPGDGCEAVDASLRQKLLAPAGATSAAAAWAQADAHWAMRALIGSGWGVWGAARRAAAVLPHWWLCSAGSSRDARRSSCNARGGAPRGFQKRATSDAPSPLARGGTQPPRPSSSRAGRPAMGNEASAVAAAVTDVSRGLEKARGGDWLEGVEKFNEAVPLWMQVRPLAVWPAAAAPGAPVAPGQACCPGTLTTPCRSSRRSGTRRGKKADYGSRST